MSSYNLLVVSVDIDVERLSRGTTGFTGADLENMVNQAALRAAIDELPAVTMDYLENSRDKVLMGKSPDKSVQSAESDNSVQCAESDNSVQSAESCWF